MIVSCNTLDEFLAEVSRAPGRVFEGLVRVRIDRDPEQDEEISFTVGLWATAVVQAEGPSGHGYVIEAALMCGIDDSDGNKGSEIAEGYRGRVLAMCETHGLKLAAGRWEL